jgi:hypothetical protein
MEPISRHELRRWCVAANLGEHQTEAALLWYCDGADTPEICAALRLSYGTVKRHLAKATRRLAIISAERHDGYGDECMCYKCRLNFSRFVVGRDGIRNAAAASKRPSRAPEGQPGRDGRAWALRGAVVTASDLMGPYERLLLDMRATGRAVAR